MLWWLVFVLHHLLLCLKYWKWLEWLVYWCYVNISIYIVVQRGAPRGQSYSQSIEGAQGPLPDVVPHSFARCRAMSESAIHSSRYLARVGSNLRDMCDEFSETTIKKNLNLIVSCNKYTCIHIYIYIFEVGSTTYPQLHMFMYYIISGYACPIYCIAESP